MEQHRAGEPNPPVKNALPPLPFTYERTYDPKEADRSFVRFSGISLSGTAPKPITDEKVLRDIKDWAEQSQWFYTDRWRLKGEPTEQVDFHGKGFDVTLYNFSKDVQVTDEQLGDMRDVIRRMASYDPRLRQMVRWILINDVQEPNTFGNEEVFPLNGEARLLHQMVLLQPRAVLPIRNRVTDISNAAGILTHEYTHFIDDDMRAEWLQAFQWEECRKHQEEWEHVTGPGIDPDVYRHKKTGLIMPVGRYPLQPDQFVSHYAQISAEDDICDSMVAYQFDRALLQSRSPKKVEILAGHDKHGELGEVEHVRIPKDQIALPRIEPKTFRYYIKEPPTAA